MTPLQRLSTFVETGIEAEELVSLACEVPFDTHVIIHQ